MSDRVTDDVMSALYAAALDDGAAGKVTLVRPSTLGMMIGELRERRAADLTGPEVEELEWLVRRIKEGEAGMNPHANHTAVLLAALSKILGGGR